MNAVAALSGYGQEAVRLNDGSHVLVRPIWRGDAPGLRRLHARLSPLTIYHRFMAPCPRPSAQALRYLSAVDHDRSEALVGVHGGEIVGVARYHSGAGAEAEIAVVVEDAWQRRGLARALMTRLAVRARERGIRAFTGSILGENAAATGLLVSLFPNADRRVSGGELEFRIPLDERRFV